MSWIQISTLDIAEIPMRYYNIFIWTSCHATSNKSREKVQKSHLGTSSSSAICHRRHYWQGGQRCDREPTGAASASAMSLSSGVLCAVVCCLVVQRGRARHFHVQMKNPTDKFWREIWKIRKPFGDTKTFWIQDQDQEDTKTF
jgi:hypothetical protein